MGRDPRSSAASTAAAVAAIIGTATDVVAVISMTMTMPVTGARTVAPKNAPIPTSAIGTVNAAAPAGHTALTPPTNNTPHSAPIARSGANSPPGTAAEYDSGPATRRTTRYPIAAG